MSKFVSEFLHKKESLLPKFTGSISNTVSLQDIHFKSNHQYYNWFFSWETKGKPSPSKEKIKFAQTQTFKLARMVKSRRSKKFSLVCRRVIVGEVASSSANHWPANSYLWVCWAIIRRCTNVSEETSIPAWNGARVVEIRSHFPDSTEMSPRPFDKVPNNFPHRSQRRTRCIPWHDSLKLCNLAWKKPGSSDLRFRGRILLLSRIRKLRDPLPNSKTLKMSHYTPRRAWLPAEGEIALRFHVSPLLDA